MYVRPVVLGVPLGTQEHGAEGDLPAPAGRRLKKKRRASFLKF